MITDVGASCLDADVTTGMSLNGFDAEPRVRPAQNEEERRRRSPGMVKDFGSSSTEDFKRLWTAEPAETAAAAPVPVQRKARKAKVFPSFDFDTPNHIRVQ